MATIVYSLSAKVDKILGKSEVMVRFFHGRLNQRAKTGIFVNKDDWDQSAQRCKIPKIRAMSIERIEEVREMKRQNDTLNELSTHITESFMRDSALTKEMPKTWLVDTVLRFNQERQGIETVIPDPVQEESQPSFLEVFTTYIETHKMADSQKRQYRVIYRALKRFSLYTGISLEFVDFSAETLRQFEDYLINEHNFIITNDKGEQLIVDRMFSSAYQQVPESRYPAERGKNTIIKMMSRLRAFFNWARKNDYTTGYPFDKYELGTAIFATPFYLTKEERTQLYYAKFPTRPGLEVQRDVFVLQSFIGCRVGDYMKMTKDNIIDDAIEYIPRKTKEGRPVTVRVPLAPTAKEILARYPKVAGSKLMPFISPQRYNDAIKEMIRLAGIDRVVTTINQLTREEEKHPIWEVASSHMARRMLVGNLYREVQDPNLIAKISGHVEGSKAFNRYRDIDEEIAKEVILKLE